MSKVRTVAVCGVTISDKQKKFLKVASGVGSHLVTGAASATIGYSVGKLISKTILNA